MEKHSSIPSVNSRTQRFIRSRRIGAILPWFGILGMLLLVFSLIMYGLLLFLTELGFIANFYYWIDSYNWLTDRLLYDPQKKVLTHQRDNIVRLTKWLFIILALVATILLAWLRMQSFLHFAAGLCFINICYFGSRAVENCLVIFHIQLNNWKRFYEIVSVGAILLIMVAATLVSCNVLAYGKSFCAILHDYFISQYG